jgi:uncharacterized protein (TIGR02285 family)
MRFFRGTFIFLLGLSASTPVVAQNPNTQFEVIWSIPSNGTLLRAPGKKGDVRLPDLSGGFAATHARIEIAATRYKHRYQVVNIVRAQEMFKQGAHLCSLTIIDTPERKDRMIFGNVMAYMLPAGMILKKKSITRYKEFIRDQAIDLQKLLEKTKFRLGVTAGRTFLPSVDSILAKTPDGQLYRYYGDASSAGLLDMLAKNRIDGMMGFYGEMNFTAELKKKSKEFDFYMVKQSTDLIPLRLSCVNSPWGQEAMAYLDPLMLPLQKASIEDVQAQYKGDLPAKLFRRYEDRVKILLKK